MAAGADPTDPSHQRQAADALPGAAEHTGQDGARALLAWYQAMGVDTFTGPAPTALVDLVPVRRSPPESGKGSQAVGSRGARAGTPSGPILGAPPAGLDAVATARERAAACGDLAALREAMENFDLCPLKEAARHLVFADGNPQADLMLVGEAPGQEEDRRGLPFVGRSGQLLDRMLAAIGLDRTGAYIANILPWRPPLNRKPDLTEIEMCLPFLIRHIELAQPKLVLALGGTAAQHILGSGEPMRSLRGRWHERPFGGYRAPVMATYHPAYLLRTPIAKRAAWADLLQVQGRLRAL